MNEYNSVKSNELLTNEYNSVKLTELAARELLEYLRSEGRIKNGVMSSMDVLMFVRIHEIGGQPVSSRFFYRDEEQTDSNKDPTGIVVRELGPYQDVIKLAEFYGVDAESLNKELREDPNCFLSIEFRHNEKRAVFRASNRFGSLGNLDKALMCYAEGFNLSNLKKLLDMKLKK